MPSLLARLGLENETDCRGWLLHANWAKGGSHPKSYAIADVTPELCATYPPYGPFPGLIW